MYLTDTHAHLNDSQFDGDLGAVISRALGAGVERIVVCGYDLPSSEKAVAIAAAYGCVYATVGVHPHDSKTYSPETERRIRDLAREPKVVAIGEIGLDFHYDFSPRDAQFAAFSGQLELASDTGMPIVVHSRESNPECLQVIRDRLANIVGCVFHCFSGDEDFAREVLDEGFYIGFDGPVTYKASEKLRRVARMCPPERILIETDCPYLAPIPHRGKRNEPAYVVHVAEALAEAVGITVDELAEATTRSAERLFRFQPTADN